MSEPAKPTPIDLVRELLVYDTEHGVLRWKHSARGRMRAGATAGCPNDAGYWIIKIKGKRYKRARLTWALCKGEDAPVDREIDHRDLDKANDRIDNLRISDHGQNMANRPAAKAGGLPKGVRQTTVNGRTMWVVHIEKNGRRRRAGPYGTLAKAISKADEVGRAMHGEFWNPSSKPLPSPAPLP